MSNTQRKTKTNSPSRSLGMYKSYNFVDKDPIIDQLRVACEGTSWDDIEARSGVSKSTLWGWFKGPTRFPRYCSVAAVVRALGMIMRVGEIPRGRRPSA